MRKTTLLSLLMLFFVNNPLLAGEKHVYGLHETIYITELGVQLDAKLDTGATTSSLSATKIQFFQQDDSTWVSFELAAQGVAAIKQQLPVIRTSRIKRRADDSTPGMPSHSERPVVMLNIAMGDQMLSTEVNLTDRSNFDYPVLLGATSLKQFNALVDVSNSYQAGNPKTPYDANK